MALDYEDYEFPAGRFKQPEDNLCAFIYEEPAVMECYKRLYPGLAAAFERGDTNATQPNLMHDVNVFATNLWMKQNVISFRTNRTIRSIIDECIHNRPVVLSGTYPYKYLNGTTGTLGHINVIAGVRFPEFVKTVEQAFQTMPETFIIDDPYGDYSNNFGPTSKRNDIEMPYKDFIRLQKDLNNDSTKWGYFITPSTGAQI